jgi:hypothetical protein
MKRVPNRIKKRNLFEPKASYFASRFGTRFIGNPEGAASKARQQQRRHDRPASTQT